LNLKVSFKLEPTRQMQTPSWPCRVVIRNRPRACCCYAVWSGCFQSSRRPGAGRVTSRFSMLLLRTSRSARCGTWHAPDSRSETPATQPPQVNSPVGRARVVMDLALARPLARWHHRYRRRRW